MLTIETKTVLTSENANLAHDNTPSFDAKRGSNYSRYVKRFANLCGGGCWPSECVYGGCPGSEEKPEMVSIDSVDPSNKILKTCEKTT